MKIYSMTATFGKLENKTLKLEPGLNILEAPNEWGKSTWCAFLISMLYGIDTRERTTGTSLADKDHYAPWSGAPMAGRMDICWNGRDITIERQSTKNRPFSDFRAYETHTGLEVSELNATNCGMMLLGVERTVFARAGFLKLTDMPVTQDDALRRRLNNLVSTGDESGDGERLAQALKDLRNRIRGSKKPGLLPQAEAEASQLEDSIRDLQQLNDRSEDIKKRQRELDDWIAQLENHKVALKYAQARDSVRHIQEAEQEKTRLEQKVTDLTAECAALPTESEAENARNELQKLHTESMSLQMEQQLLPPAPEKPVVQKCFVGLTAEQALQMAQADVAQAEQLNQKSPLTNIGIGAIAVAVLAIVAGMFLQVMFAVGVVALAAGVCLLVMGTNKTKQAKAKLWELALKYETDVVSLWVSMAMGYGENLRSYEKALESYEKSAGQLRERAESLLAKLQAMTKGESIGACLNHWEEISNKWKKLTDLQRDVRHAEGRLETLRSVSQDLPAPAAPDHLTMTSSETDAAIVNAQREQKENQELLGRYQGKAETIGQESALMGQLKQVRERIEKLEDTDKALEYASTALNSARDELQRRFAPRIAKRAEELLGKLTDGRYDQIILTNDLNVEMGTQDDIAPRKSLYRSDGTVDQMYLALRLAVAEELTPDAPLVLDDAMVRFDDARLKTALHILEETAENKQVILFTCQTREKKLRGEA